jgi:hypothetical protein
MSMVLYRRLTQIAAPQNNMNAAKQQALLDLLKQYKSGVISAEKYEKKKMKILSSY